ncbi:EF-hand calcium-binding domain-containing protein 14-like isoform X2 [Gigantopelta aegis]|uniref:EF-hand calcium-binding domain-containing protein 14-like isoform X2 n=1 Tax=Gigantopelta aegis TaxID=1735272 RepID=UPI001B88B26E|nr:EF-hand calcium-binding domain-containing protein 14-like isoform X2 [Gigantopelta aegis]
MMPKNGMMSTSNQDYVNLLYSDSESDPPDLKLPPLKGKKPRKKKTPYKAMTVDASLCSWITFLRIVAFMVVMATMVSLSIVCYSLFQNMQSLITRLEKIENHGQMGLEDLQDIKRQLQNLNRTVQAFKKDNVDMTKKINLISEKIVAVSSDTEKLKESLETAPELKDLPKLVDTLSESLAGLGSELQTTKGTVDQLKTNSDKTSTEIKHLADRVVALEVSSNRTLSGRESVIPGKMSTVVDVGQTVSDLRHGIYEVNHTLRSAVSALSQRIVQLETAKNSSAVTDGKLGFLLTKVENMTSSVTKIKQLYQQVQENKGDQNVTKASQPTAEDFTEFKEQTQLRFQGLNGTVVRLMGDMSNLYLQFTRNSNSLVNISAHVDGILRHLASVTTQNENATWEQHHVTNFHEMNNKTTTTTAQPSTSMSLKDILTSTQPDSKTISITVPGSGESIDSMDKLDRYFNRWDVKGNGLVDPKGLSNFLGPAAPSEDDLKPFDENGDGKYSLEEFANALGITDFGTTDRT